MGGNLIKKIVSPLHDGTNGVPLAGTLPRPQIGAIPLTFGTNHPRWFPLGLGLVVEDKQLLNFHMVKEYRSPETRDGYKKHNSGMKYTCITHVGILE